MAECLQHLASLLIYAETRGSGDNQAALPEPDAMKGPKLPDIALIE